MAMYGPSITIHGRPRFPYQGATPAVWHGYATATPDNPSAQLTDYTLLLGLSGLPAEFWADVHPTGKDIRITDGSNNILPRHLISFDREANTGLVAFKFTKTTNNQAIRVWSGNWHVDAPAAGDPDGQYAAYKTEVQAFYPNGIGNDATTNARHLTSAGSPTIGGTTGPFDDALATSLNGSTQYGSHATGLGVGAAGGAYSFLTWVNPTLDQLRGVFGLHNGEAVATFERGNVDISATSVRATGQTAAAGIGVAETTAAPNAAVWNSVAAVRTSSSARAAFVNGGNKGTNADTITQTDPYVKALIGAHQSADGGGAQANSLFGSISLSMLLSEAVSDAFVAYFHAMGNQTTFWNTWTWTDDPTDLEA